MSALDVSIQAQIINLLEDLKRRLGLSLLFISHDIAVMEYISDRIAVVYLGRVMEIGPTAEICSNPKHPYTEALLSAVPNPDPTQRKQRIVLEGDVPNAIAPPSGCVFRTRCRYAIDECAHMRCHRSGTCRRVTRPPASGTTSCKLRRCGTRTESDPGAARCQQGHRCPVLLLTVTARSRYSTQLRGVVTLSRNIRSRTMKQR